MIQFFQANTTVYAVETKQKLSPSDLQKLSWLFACAKPISESFLQDAYIGPRKEMITPWSTNAVEITQNMGLQKITRIERFEKTDDVSTFDPMIEQKYEGLTQDIFKIDVQPESIQEIENISEFNQKEGLALSEEEIDYLENLSKKLNRKLTDSEVFGFSQVNSEHCRHKIFNGKFIIDGKEKPSSLFKLIKKTSAENPNTLISAYKDNVAFIDGPTVVQFAPKSFDKADFYQEKYFKSVISLKAETHNFPTTVEPFNGAATGSGGEIRDRLAGGKGSLPLAGTAVYMTAYPRLRKNASHEKQMPERKWLYQTPLDILIKASNGASDFGNKFGQPLICGSILTFENETDNRKLAYDKVIMQAGGIGFAKEKHSLKDKPKANDAIVILGGENYRIGMGGAAVSSADTGTFSNAIELNAVQRSNPEMQKRVANTIRAMVESDNTIISIHDHGAGGHLNCLSELVEDTGGIIYINKLPIGDETLSEKEIIGNESQERMGLVIDKKDLNHLQNIAERERAPFYEVGTVTNDMQFTFKGKTNKNPIDLALADMFGSSPQTIMEDETIQRKYPEISYDKKNIYQYAKQVLQLEAVACKDWLTNKVDRCVTGRVAKQQTCGALQLPLNNVGVMALDFKGIKGIATSVGHAPISALINEKAGSKNAIAKALTNIVFAPLEENLKSVSLSANWMWPCNNKGEDARLYNAVEAVSEFAIELGINIPTGKDSLSMKQKYADYDVLAPGTVIISATGQSSDIKKVVEPILQPEKNSYIIYINFSQDVFKLGGSSFAQTLGKIGTQTPTIKDTPFFKKAFNAIQKLIKEELVLAGHDISAGGMLTTLLEMTFAENNIGATIDFSGLPEKDMVKILFSENAGIILQVKKDAKTTEILKDINHYTIGRITDKAIVSIKNEEENLEFDIPTYRDYWYETSSLFDKEQTRPDKAKERFDNYKKQPLQFDFPKHFTGKLSDMVIKGKKQSNILSRKNAKKQSKRPIAAVIREKGSNSEREMANAMYIAGFDVKDIHMTDLISGRENLDDIQFLVAVGGFSNSDVLGSAKGWAGAFLFNEKAKKALDNFYARKDTLSLGVCNGCQLFTELGLLNPEDKEKPKMLHNDSGKFECNFTSVKIQDNKTVMFHSLSGSKLGIWAAHGEGKFHFPYAENHYNIVGKYGYEGFPANPNDSDYNTAILSNKDGRHIAMMPHLERSTYNWNWAKYPKDRKNDQVTPWVEAFVNARLWLQENGEL